MAPELLAALLWLGTIHQFSSAPSYPLCTYSGMFFSRFMHSPLSLAKSTYDTMSREPAAYGKSRYYNYSSRLKIRARDSYDERNNSDSVSSGGRLGYLQHQKLEFSLHGEKIQPLKQPYGGLEVHKYEDASCECHPCENHGDENHCREIPGHDNLEKSSMGDQL